jgi:hypothetical protein
MKKDLPLDKIKEFFLKRRKLFIYIASFSLLVFVIVGSYAALNPGADETAKTTGEEKLKDLEVYFDQNTLEEIEQQQAPAVVNGEGGRNPFMPY